MSASPSSAPTAAVFFDELLPARLGARAAELGALDAIYAFRIRGEGGGEWTVVAGPDPSVSRGIAPGASCAVETDAATFRKLCEEPPAGRAATVSRLFFSGGLQVHGNRMLGTKLPLLLAVGLGS